MTSMVGPKNFSMPAICRSACSRDIFPASTIDATIRQLAGFSDQNLRDRLDNDPDGLRALAQRFMHSM